MYSVVGSTARNLTTGKLVPELPCSHTEADTAMFTIYSMLQSEGYTAAVVLDTGKTGNYVQAAYVAQRASCLLCVKCNPQLITAQCLCSEAMSASIIPLHIFTGCDHNTDFYGARKKLITNCLEKSKEAHNPANSVWLTAPSGTKRSSVICHPICLLWATLGEGEQQGAEFWRKKILSHLCRLGQSLSTLGAWKLSSIKKWKHYKLIGHR